MSSKYIAHMAALFIAVIWGVTCVSTKTLYAYGILPQDVYFYRFVIAYLFMIALSHRQVFANSVKDELRFVLLGLAGGSCYYMAENIALDINYATNVALILSTTPIITTLILYALGKTAKPSANLIVGSALALVGVSLVILNGNLVLHINPLGDILSLIGAVIFSIYTITLRSIEDKYSPTFITRKTFFYGVLTLIPFMWHYPLTTDIYVLTQPEVIINFLFLAVIASVVCYILWSMCMNSLGAIVTSNYLYVIPIVTMIASSLFLNEHITGIALTGSALILIGVYMAGSANGIQQLAHLFSHKADQKESKI